MVRAVLGHELRRVTLTLYTLHNVIQSALRRHCVITAMTLQTLIYTV
jgi:hypothetical protein